MATEALTAAKKRGDQLSSSVIIRSELIQGARAGERDQIDRLFETIEWLDVTKSIADKAGELAKKYRKSHPGISLGDYLIAATVTEHGLSLWTRNTKHFPMIKGLKPPY